MKIPIGEPEEEIDLHSPIEKVLSETFGKLDALPIKWIVICETLEADGERHVRQVASTGILPWESLGLLDMALVNERAEAVNCDYEEE